MAILEVLQYPDPRLRQKAKPVTTVNDDTQKIVSDMFDTLYGSENCAGYAAIQMGITQQIIVIDISRLKNEPICLINPKILQQEGESYEPEGCMSLPDIYAPVKRAEWLKVEALNEKGQKFLMEAEGFLSTCIQHEIDHLNGILFIDYLSKIKRAKIEKALQKMRKG